MPPEGLPQLSAYDPCSPSNFGAGSVATPMSQHQPQSARPSTARTNRESADDPSYIQERTEHDATGVRSPAGTINAEDEMRCASATTTTVLYSYNEGHEGHAGDVAAP